MLPAAEAQTILARIRAGTPIETICNQVTAGDALIQLSVAPETQFRYNLPYRAEMPDEYIPDNPYLSSLLYEKASLYAANANMTERLLSTPRDGGFARSESAHETAYLRPFHAAVVVDPLLDDAKLSRWTAVCKDDAFLRDLLGIWFRCEYSFTSAIQKDYFLDDMASMRTDFCSELLVNAVLAYCCVSTRLTC